METPVLIGIQVGTETGIQRHHIGFKSIFLIPWMEILLYTCYAVILLKIIQLKLGSLVPAAVTLLTKLSSLIMWKLATLLLEKKDIQRLCICRLQFSIFVYMPLL